ncbi:MULTISPECIES: NAD/NADP-dependent octopine/nopaline dehydrogenase family protein [unclassified Adlercreutzia]|uniref:NAD/NADP-dependent octopine/nopaline dehydrogenase family protein n=1 Tax=unclassified Adlercreutzia TaxID=2636013 RepID=UPI0013EADBFE|nr:MULTISPECIES: NAD/NADP-dependent octopine/nopaline dehydrogenase family protein [unclassified Adlercreutzia]
MDETAQHSHGQCRGPVFVCGAGHQGLSMAAHLAISGHGVTLWNRTLGNIAEVARTLEIRCTGVVSGVGKIKAASDVIDEVVGDLIMVATPSSAHKDVARRLAPFVHEDMVVVLNPGRTFGAIEFAQELLASGVKSLPHIAETQTIAYTCRRDTEGNAVIHAIKDGVRIATLGDDMDVVMAALPACLAPHFEPVSSVAITSLGNVGMILHCAPVLLNCGWIETEDVDFKYYYHGISPSIAGFIERLDRERIAVARALGFEVESTADWMRRVYGVEGEGILECIRNNPAYREIDAPPTIRCRYVLEDVPNGLVPLADLALQLGVPAPCANTVIDLADEVIGSDFRSTGRRFPVSVLEKYIGDMRVES